MNYVHITCPLYPSINAWPSHWRAKGKAKKAYAESVAVRVWEVIGVRLLNWQRAEVRIVLHFRANRRRDMDNYVGGAKWLIDGLGMSGLIADDSAAVIGTPIVEFGAVDRERPRAEVTVTRLEG